MQFPVNIFSDLLVEFQKYISSRIPWAILSTLGVSMGTLGVITGYIVGWDRLSDEWNHLDNVFKFVLCIGTGLFFLLTGYMLTGLQGTVEGWFQGDWPFGWGSILGQLRYHRKVWQERESAFQEMADLYSETRVAQDAMTQWGMRRELERYMVRTTKDLPRFHICTLDDLELVQNEGLSIDCLQDSEAIVGKMLLRPLARGAAVLRSNIVSLPPYEGDQMATELISLTASIKIVPAGLVPGDKITLYIREARRRRHILCKEDVLVVALEQLAGQESLLMQVTCVVGSSDVALFVDLSEDRLVRITRLISQDVSVHVADRNSESLAKGIHVHQEQQSDSNSNFFIEEKLAALKGQYEAGEAWLRHLREGRFEKVPEHLGLLTEAFSLLELENSALESTSPTRQQLDHWRRIVNGYRNRWLRLLQQAFDELDYRIDLNQKAFALYYPSSLEKVAPTIIGNIFQAVDSYGYTLYGLDYSLVLPRLQVVLEQETRQQLSTAYDRLALCEWHYLGWLTTCTIGSFLAFVSQHYFLATVLWLISLPVAQFIIYPAILRAALDYATALRLIIDRERGKVLAQAGFTLPSTMTQEEERALWKQAQQWWIYGTDPGEYTLDVKSVSNEKKA